MRNPHQSSSSFNPSSLTTTAMNGNGSWFFHLKFFAIVIGIYLGLVCWLIFERCWWLFGFGLKLLDLKWKFFLSKLPLLFLLASVPLGLGLNSMSGSSSSLFLSSLMIRIGLNDRGEEKRGWWEAEHQLREGENLSNREWGCWVGLIFLGLCVFNFVFVFWEKQIENVNKGKCSSCVLRLNLGLYSCSW